MGMVEGHEKYKETTEDLMNRLTDLMFAQIDFKKHDA